LGHQSIGGLFLSSEGVVVIDYFAIGVLALIALLAVARLFPPPDQAQ
jgi:hypothetical protein